MSVPVVGRKGSARVGAVHDDRVRVVLADKRGSTRVDFSAEQVGELIGALRDAVLTTHQQVDFFGEMRCIICRYPYGGGSMDWPCAAVRSVGGEA